jgi:hypothetical protein
MPKAPPFKCSHCGTAYQVVRIDSSDNEYDDVDVSCLACGEPLKGKEGGSILKYFRVDGPRGRFRHPSQRSCDLPSVERFR